MNVTSSAHPKKVQRLKPTIRNLCNIGETIVCIFLLPAVFIASIINAVRKVRHSPREAIESLLSPTLFGCMLYFGGLGYGIYDLFHDLIFGRPD